MKISKEVCALTRYEELLDEAYNNNLIVKEKPLEYYDGRIKGNKIAIRKTIETSAQKACVLAEELGHHYTSAGDILDLNNPSNARQENIARLWAYDKLVGFGGIIRAYKKRLTSSEEIADYLDISVDFLHECIDYYSSIYGPYVQYHGFFIRFSPCFRVFRLKKR